MINASNSLARAIIRRIFDQDGWGPITDRERAIDIALEEWDTNVPISEAITRAKQKMDWTSGNSTTPWEKRKFDPEKTRQRAIEHLGMETRN